MDDVEFSKQSKLFKNRTAALSARQESGNRKSILLSILFALSILMGIAGAITLAVITGPYIVAGLVGAGVGFAVAVILCVVIDLVLVGPVIGVTALASFVGLGIVAGVFGALAKGVGLFSNKGQKQYGKANYSGNNAEHVRPREIDGKSPRTRILADAATYQHPYRSQHPLTAEPDRMRHTLDGSGPQHKR